MLGFNRVDDDVIDYFGSTNFEIAFYGSCVRNLEGWCFLRRTLKSIEEQYVNEMLLGLIWKMNI